MSYWRKLFLIVLLALSLPVQSFAAVSMICAGSEAVDDEVTDHHVHLDDSADGHILVADNDDHHGHDHSGAHHAHACLTCASCCVGAALPVVPSVSASADQIQFSAPLPPDAGVVLFLTDGIERPPRSIPV
jgi:hypothetical protein